MTDHRAPDGCCHKTRLMGSLCPLGYECPFIKTVKRSELSITKMTTGGEKTWTVVIDGGQLFRWVGIGWMAEGSATPSHYKEFPIIIDG